MDGPDTSATSSARFADLCRQIKEGCKKAFGAFVQLTWVWAIKLVRYLLRGVGVGMYGKEEDVAQEGYFKLWRARHRLKPSRGIQSYLAAILKNEVYRLGVKRGNAKGSGAPPEEFPAPPAPRAAEQERKEMTEVLDRILAGLSDRERIVVDNLAGIISNAEAMRRLGRSKTILHELKNSVKEKLRLRAISRFPQLFSSDGGEWWLGAEYS